VDNYRVARSPHSPMPDRISQFLDRSRVIPQTGRRSLRHFVQRTFESSANRVSHDRLVVGRVYYAPGLALGFPPDR
jgi:hypothetical protein